MENKIKMHLILTQPNKSSTWKELNTIMVLAMGKAMIFVVDSDEAVGQCDDEDRRKLEALAAKDHETAERQNNNEGEEGE